MQQFVVDEAMSTIEMANDVARDRREIPEFADLIGGSGPMLEVLRTVERVAQTDLPVLILGESGTGKEVVARTLHLTSPRAGRPFLAVPCGALTERLLEAELFGYSADTFAGVGSGRAGVLSEAAGGTVLLDDVTDLSPALQARLINALKTNEIQPIGSTDRVRIDVRVIATTTRDPEALALSGQFREDLLRGLSVISLRLPPLRERGRDIDAMITSFLARYRNPGAPPMLLSADALERLRSYSWPGNVRELRHTMQRLAGSVSGGSVTLADLPERIRSTHAELDVLIHEMPSQDVVGKAWPSPDGEFADERPVGDPDRAWLPLFELERRYLIRVLYYTRGNKKRAASILGVDRKTLSRMVERHTINVARIKRDVRGLR